MRRFSKIALNSVVTFVVKFIANLFGPAIHHTKAQIVAKSLRALKSKNGDPKTHLVFY